MLRRVEFLSAGMLTLLDRGVTLKFSQRGGRMGKHVHQSFFTGEILPAKK